MSPARLRAYTQLLIVAAIWGIAGPIIKYTLGAFEPLVFLTYRFGLSTIASIVAFLLFGFKFPKKPKVFKQLLLYALLNSPIALGFLFFGLKNTTVLDMSLITLANPIVITLAGYWFLAEHVTKRERLGMGIALLGTAFIVFEPLIQNGGSEIKLSGNILMIGYLIATGWAAILVKRLLRAGVTPLTMTGVSFIVGFLCLLPFAILFSPTTITQVAQTPIGFHLGVFYMALLSGNLAYWLGNRAQKTIEIGDASLFAYLYPIFSTPLAVFWLGEKITPIFVVGAVIITFGVAIAEIKKKRYN